MDRFTRYEIRFQTFMKCSGWRLTKRSLRNERGCFESSGFEARMLFLARFESLWVGAFERGVLGSCGNAFGKVWALEMLLGRFVTVNETRGSKNGLEIWGFKTLQSN